MEPLTYLVKSATILTMFYLIYMLFLRKETHFKAHRVYLILGVVASVLLPFLYFTQSIHIDIPAVEYTTHPPITGLTPTHEPVVIEEPFNWWNVAIAGYLLGSCIMLLRLFTQLGSLWMLITTNPSQKLNSFRYVRVNRRIAPFSFFNYIVYNPQLHSETELQMILKHEQAHAFQWHSTDILLANLLLVLQWCNPFAWLYKKSVEENLEFLADNATIVAVPDKKDYQLALVKASSARYVPSLTTNFYKSFIKKRIIMLNKRTSKKYHVLKVAAILPLLAVFLYSFNLKQDITYNVIPSESEPLLETIFELQPESAASETPQSEISQASTVAASAEEISEEPISKAEIDRPVVAKVNTSMYTGADFRKIEFKITKKTTDAQLEEIKRTAKKEHKIDLSYSVERNSNNDITRIQIIYSGKDSNGNYSIHDEEGIADFVFYVNEDGRSGFYSEEVEARRAERMAERTARLEQRSRERGEDVDRLREKREQMREDMIEEREAMRKQMIKERKEMRDKMKEHRKEVIIKGDGGSHVIIDDEGDVIKRYKIASAESGKGSSQVYVLDKDSNELAHWVNGPEHSVVIDKNTSNNELAELKKKFKAKGIDFKYSKVKRNSQGEITGIKITVDDNKGSKRTIVSKSDDGDPINQMLIELQ